jgi:hypothetical protein
MEVTMGYDRWRRIRVPEPPVYPPGSAWSKLLGLIVSIEKTGVIDTAEAREVAEALELRRTPEDQDLARLCWALSRSCTIRNR